MRRILAEMDTAGAELRALLEGAPGGEVQRGEEEEPRGAGAVEAEGPRAGGGVDRRVLPVAHTAAGGQLSLLTRTANDAAPASRPSRPSESAEELAALKPRLVAAVAAGHSARGIGAAAGVDAASITRWLSGARPGVSLASAHKLAAHLASIGF